MKNLDKDRADLCPKSPAKDEALPDLSEIEFDDEASVPSYESMTREELIEACKTHDAHHQEHHDREKIKDEALRIALAALKVAPCSDYRAFVIWWNTAAIPTIVQIEAILKGEKQ